MTLNVKNPDAHRLAAELASLTGESMSTAVTIAVRERLERVRRTPRAGMAERILALGVDCARRLSSEQREMNADDWLYDDDGLPA